MCMFCIWPAEAQFQQRISRAILGVHWQYWITNVRIFEQADTTIKWHRGIHC